MTKYCDDKYAGGWVDTLQTRLRPHNSGTQYRTLWQLLHLDMWLLTGVIILMSFGFFILYSASNAQFGLVLQAISHLGLTIIIMFMLAQLPPSLYQRWSPWLYAFGVTLLLAVLIVGHINKGAQRWLSISFLHFQPSELMKLAIPMMLAWYYANRPLPPRFTDIIISSVIIIVPLILTLKEPDLGTAMMLLIGGSCVLLLAGLRWRFILGSLTMLLIAIPIFWHFMHDYQRQRILTFFNPERDPLGAGYHIIQSKIAIGSGGIFGKGFLQGTQTHLHFLPEHTTDFIFSVCGEDFGLLGCLLLLAIYLFVVGRCCTIAYRAQDTYTRLLAGSLSLMFLLSIFVNIGMVSGLLPVVGLPLPLVSYGGSSMLSVMMSFGILMSIQGHRNLLER